jgi:hypothetical protein
MFGNEWEVEDFIGETRHDRKIGLGIASQCMS